MIVKEDTGQILIVDKIVNNNIVIAKDFRGREVVAIGKGVGFRKRKNEAVHRSEIMKTYVLLDKVDSGVLTLFEEIQFEVIETSQKIIDYAQEKLNEYSCAVTPQVRQTGNRLSGLAGTAYASLLA